MRNLLENSKYAILVVYFQLADNLQLAVVPVPSIMENINETLTEVYVAIESALPEKYQGMVKNENQDR